MDLEIDRAAGLDTAITDACEFLGIAREQFFDLARQWGRLGPELWAEHGAEGFYRAWTGEAGRANLCANIIDQYSRPPIWTMLFSVFTQVEVHYFLDFGCGTASVSFPFVDRCQSAILADVPNLAQEFLGWRVERHGLRDVAVLAPDAAAALPDGLLDFVMCVDVLEHLTNPSEVFAGLDRLLRPDGYFLYRAPWAREDEDLSEHLPEAPVDWNQPGGGAAQLRQRYRAVAPLDFGGLYQKLR